MPTIQKYLVEEEPACPPSKFMIALSNAMNFREACDIAHRWYKATARTHRTECQKAGVSGDLEFWPRCERDALQALAIYDASCGDEQRAIARLLQFGLVSFARALRTGDYAGELGF